MSLEPQIGAVDLEKYLPRKADCDGCGWAIAGGCDFCRPESTVDRDGLDLVIQGCESGPRRRPFDLRWARDVRDQCRAAGVHYALKQIQRCKHYITCKERRNGDDCTPGAGYCHGMQHVVYERPGLDGDDAWDLPWSHEAEVRG